MSSTRPQWAQIMRDSENDVNKVATSETSGFLVPAHLTIHHTSRLQPNRACGRHREMVQVLSRSSILPTLQPTRTRVPATANINTILEQEARSTRAILAFKSRSGDRGRCTYSGDTFAMDLLKKVVRHGRGDACVDAAFGPRKFELVESWGGRCQMA